MLFQSLEFLLFFVPVYLLNLVLANRFQQIRFRGFFLVFVSALFYMSWNIPLFALLAGSILLNFAIGNRIHASAEQSRRWIVFGIASQLALLAVFKYANFGIDSVLSLLNLIGMELPHTTLEIVLPLGISFYTFHGMSYLIDIYRGKYPPYGSLLDFFLYITYFPHLIAGPIIRADYFLDRLRRAERPLEVANFTSGLMLLVAGIFKKSVLADNATKISDLAFLDPNVVSSLMVLLGIYAFAFQIYFDFSGYTDMARGLGRMLGIELPINFDLPYLSRGLREFWQRWHISLSSWLRDYLYISLGGSRVTKLITYRNLMITMLLGGLWHGASYTFLVWGGIHGLGLAIEHATAGKGRREISSRLLEVLTIFLTFNLVCLAWVFFRAENLASAVAILAKLTELSGYLRFEELALFKPQNWLFGMVFPAIFTFAIERRFRINEIGFEMRSPLRQAVVFTVMLFLIFLTGGKTSEFIYFQF